MAMRSRLPLRLSVLLVPGVIVTATALTFASAGTQAKVKLNEKPDPFTANVSTTISGPGFGVGEGTTKKVSVSVSLVGVKTLFRDYQSPVVGGMGRYSANPRPSVHITYNLDEAYDGAGLPCNTYQHLGSTDATVPLDIRLPTDRNQGSANILEFQEEPSLQGRVVRHVKIRYRLTDRDLVMAVSFQAPIHFESTRMWILGDAGEPGQCQTDHVVKDVVGDFTATFHGRVARDNRTIAFSKSVVTTPEVWPDISAEELTGAVTGSARFARKVTEAR